MKKKQCRVFLLASAVLFTTFSGGCGILAAPEDGATQAGTADEMVVVSADELMNSDSLAGTLAVDINGKTVLLDIDAIRAQAAKDETTKNETTKNETTEDDTTEDDTEIEEDEETDDGTVANENDNEVLRALVQHSQASKDETIEDDTEIDEDADTAEYNKNLIIEATERIKREKELKGETTEEDEEADYETDTAYEAGSLSQTLPEYENTIHANVDGEDFVFYLGNSSESAGGCYWYTTYTVPNDGEEKLSIMLDPEMEAGETRTSSAEDEGFQIYYNSDGLQTRYARHGEWRVTMDEISSSGRHMEGSFYTSAALRNGKSPVEIIGTFNLNFGDSVPEAEEVYAFRNQGGSGSAAGSDRGLSNDVQNKTTCSACGGLRRCSHCAGWGYIDSNNDGVLDFRCGVCGGSGRCSICRGRGYTTY